MQLHTYTHVGLIRPILNRDISEILTQACWHDCTNLGRTLELKLSPAPVLSAWKTLRVTLIHCHACPAVQL